MSVVLMSGVMERMNLSLITQLSSGMQQVVLWKRVDRAVPLKGSTGMTGSTLVLALVCIYVSHQSKTVAE